MHYKSHIVNARYRGPVESMKVLYETGRFATQIRQAAEIELLRQSILYNTYDKASACHIGLRQRISFASKQIKALILVLQNAVSQHATGGSAQ